MLQVIFVDRPCFTASGCPPWPFVDAPETPQSLTDANGTALLLARGRAFEIFRRSVRRSSINAENKVLLKKLYARARELGDCANAARQAVVQATKKVKQLRVSQMSTVPGAKECHTVIQATRLQVLEARDSHLISAGACTTLRHVFSCSAVVRTLHTGMRFCLFRTNALPFRSRSGINHCSRGKLPSR